jgi:hypothetical protein
MAIPIKQVPILSGEIAEEFEREADAREKNPSPALSKEDEAQVAKVMRQLREFIPSWRKK